MQIGNSKKVGIEILISDKINFKTKAIKKDKEGHHIVIKKSMSEENITLVSIYVPNMCMCGKLPTCLTLCDPMDCNLPGSSVHGISPHKNTGVGCHALLQGILPTQKLKLLLSRLLHLQADSLPIMSLLGSPK